MYSKVGERLREERERLGHTQAAFAKKTGISSRALRNYESGTRVPDVHYLLAAWKLGADYHYIVTGAHEGEREAWLAAQGSVLLALATMLEIGSDDLNELSRLAMEGITDFNSNKSHHLIEKLVELLAKSPALVMLRGNTEAIANEIELLELLFSNVESTLPREKRARAIAMLYRSFKASGKMDDKMIEDAISLAS